MVLNCATMVIKSNNSATISICLCSSHQCRKLNTDVNGALHYVYRNMKTVEEFLHYYNSLASQTVVFLNHLAGKTS